VNGALDRERWSDELALDCGDYDLWFLKKMWPVGLGANRLGGLADIGVIAGGVGVLMME